MPKGIYNRRPRAEVVKERIEGRNDLSKVRSDSAMARWESVREEKENWLIPFRKLDVERALRYLEDLRIICSEAGVILNERINSGKKIKCSGPRCGNDLTGLRPNGMPKWVAKKDFKDLKNPEVWHCLYFCSDVCSNEWTRAQMGMAGDAHGKENRVA